MMPMLTWTHLETPAKLLSVMNPKVSCGRVIQLSYFRIPVDLITGAITAITAIMAIEAVAEISAIAAIAAVAAFEAVTPIAAIGAIVVL